MAPDPKADLRDFLRSGLVSSDTSVAFAPADDVVVANYDAGPAWPEVAVVSSDWVTLGGGQTGATSMDPTGAGSYQEGYYSVLVDCWGGPRGEYDSADVAADTVAEDLGQAVARVTRVGVAQTGALSDYEYCWSTPPSDANNSQATPTEYRRQVRVRLAYRYAP